LLAEHLRQDAPETLEHQQVCEHLVAMRAVHGRYWRKAAREPGSEEALAAAALHRLAELDLIRLIRVDDEYHFFSEGFPLNFEDPRGCRIVGHAVSKDLMSWEELPPTISCGPPGSFDAYCIYHMDVFFQVTRDGGATFQNLGTGREKHSDNHALWIDPDDGSHLIAGTDAGLYETFDETANWKFFANMPITQFYKVTVDNDALYLKLNEGDNELVFVVSESFGGWGLVARLDKVDGITLTAEAPGRD